MMTQSVICNSSALVCHNVAWLYAEPDDNSERVHQLIYNDTVETFEEHSGFVRVDSGDDCPGWIRREHLSQNFDEHGVEINRVITGLVVPVYEEQDTESDTITQVTFGTLLYGDNFDETGFEGVDLPSQIEGEYMGGFVRQEVCDHIVYWNAYSGTNIAYHANLMRGVPYLWGGTTPFGFDCSGLVYRIYDFFNVPLPRDAYQQYESPLGDKLSEGEPYQAGDLVFWVGKSDPRNRGITHVGIMMDETQVIHAYSKMGVIVTPFAEMTSKLGYTYRGAWRYRNEAAE